jgi:hypothetical protein
VHFLQKLSIQRLHLCVEVYSGAQLDASHGFLRCDECASFKTSDVRRGTPHSRI